MSPRREQSVLDELLVLQCQAGDLDALDELVKRWQPRLWRHVRRLSGADDAAWDLTQEAWLAIVQGIRALADPAMFRAWAYRIAANKCADWLRRRRRERIDAAEHDLEDQSASGSEGAQDDLQTALKNLSADRREILVFRYLDELSTAEIAAVLGIPEGTVKSRLHHARNHLREVLERGSPRS